MAQVTFHTILCNSADRLGGVAMTARELTRWTRGPEAEGVLWSLHAGALLDRAYDRPVIPPLAFRAMCKLGAPKSWMDARLRRAALREVRPGELVYQFPPYDRAFQQRARARGAILVMERINCMGPTCRDAIAPAFARHGLRPAYDWFDAEWNAEEQRQVEGCDFVTAPNAFVTRSLLDAGVPRARILETSYGWSPTRLAAGLGVERPERDPVFLFVGMGILRKGLDLLLEAWDAAQVRGTLLVAGQIFDEVRGVCGPLVARPSVRLAGYVADIAQLYAAADVFVFPSHEEGGPQVNYEAAACGLPCLVSPMGAGRIITDGREGFVIDPWDKDRWVEAIRLLARDVALRRRMGAQAAEAAREFTWERVGARLRGHFQRLVGAARAEVA